MEAYDAILVPGGGVRSNGQLPLWSQRRLNRAIEKSQTTNAYIIALSAGTTHKPPPLDTDGYPIFESVASAHYLIQQGVAPEKILMETSSYDTIGNVYFSRMIHVEPLHLRRLLVVTSEFHMPRTKAIFQWIYRLEGLPQNCHLFFESVSDDDLPLAALTARKLKEANSLQALLETAKNIHTLQTFHHWLFTHHGAYAISSESYRDASVALETY